MKCVTSIGVLVLTVSALVLPAAAQHSLRFSSATELLPGPRSNCSIGTPCCNHDGSAENRYGWAPPALKEPYYGAFAEAYDLGAGTLTCAVYWFSQIGYFHDHPMDVYVWDGGVPIRMAARGPGLSGLPKSADRGSLRPRISRGAGRGPADLRRLGQHQGALSVARICPIKGGDPCGRQSAF